MMAPEKWALVPHAMLLFSFEIYLFIWRCFIYSMYIVLFDVFQAQHHHMADLDRTVVSRDHTLRYSLVVRKTGHTTLFLQHIEMRLSNLSRHRRLKKISGKRESLLRYIVKYLSGDVVWSFRLKLFSKCPYYCYAPPSEEEGVYSFAGGILSVRRRTLSDQ